MPFAVNYNIKTPAVTGIDFASILAVCFVIYASTHVGGGGVEPPAVFLFPLARPYECLRCPPRCRTRSSRMAAAG